MNHPAPGFTKYPQHRVVATQQPRHVRALVGDIVVADTRAAFEVEETRHDPVWYFPPDHVDQSRLTPTESTTYCPFKGHASYWSIDTDSETLTDAAWAYLAPYDECRVLTGYIAFYPDRVSIEVDGRLQRPT